VVWLAGEDGARVAHAVLAVAPGRPGELRLRLEGVASRAAAEALCGRSVLAGASHLRAPGDGEYYGHQLIGCRVEAEGGRELGRVTGIWSTGAPDVLIVTDGQGRERLIPAAAAFLREVDVAGRRITIEAIPGLLDPAGAG
jgi:16S rRNA processing protein RimM